MKIRLATVEDAVKIREIYAYYVEHTAITFEYQTPSVKEMESRIAHTLQQYPYLVLEEDGQLIGYAYAGPFKTRDAYRFSCELSIYLDHTKARGGYGTRLYDALETQLKQRGFKNLYACIGLPIGSSQYVDHGSETFHAKRGFVTVGHFHACGYKFDEWFDMIWMEKRI